MNSKLMLSAALVLAASAVFAQATRDRSDEVPDDLPSFEEADADGDGLLSQEEAKAIGIPEDIFEEEDHNYDGLISEPTYRYVLKGEKP